MKAEDRAALTAAKKRRYETTTALATVTEGITLDRIAVEGWQANVRTLEQTRATSINTGRVEAVVALDADLLRARVALEIASARLTASNATHAVAVAERRDAERAVATAARAAIDAEMIDLADEFTVAYDHAMVLGARLRALSYRNPFNRPMNAEVETLPRVVEDALAKIPQPNRLDVPLNMLRAGGGMSCMTDVWEQRLAVLTADDVELAA